MQLSRADVVLLNSDTIVTARLARRAPALRGDRSAIGTITPFSNNAEICSFPRFCEDNPWPAGRDPEPMRAALAAAAVPTYPGSADRRRLLPVPPARADRRDRRLRPGVRRGLRRGERSLPARGAGRLAQRAGRQRVRRAYRRPLVRGTEGRARRRATWRCCSSAIRITSTWCAPTSPPIRCARCARRRAARLAVDAAPGRGVLHVIHDHGGGTETHVRALIDGSRSRWRHYLAIAVGDRWQVEEHRADGGVVTFDSSAARTNRGAISSAASARRSASRSSTCTTFPPAATGSSRRWPTLPVPYGYTVHDLNFACPTITFLGADGMYCGGADRCRRVRALPRGAAGVRRHRHRAGARGTRAAAAGGVPDRAVAVGGGDARALFSGRAGDVIAHGTPDASLRRDARRTSDARCCPTTACRRSRCWARSAPTRARAGSSGWLRLRARAAPRALRADRLSGRSARALAVRRRACSRSTAATTPPICPSSSRTIASRSCCIRRRVPRRSATRCPRRGPRAGRCSCRRSARWTSACADSGAGWVMTEAEWRDEARMLDRVLALLGTAACAMRATRGAPRRAHAARDVARRWPTRPSRL